MVYFQGILALNVGVCHEGSGMLEIIDKRRQQQMKHVKTLSTKKLQDTVKKGGCGECQTSCQSACKTSCTVGNQSCEKK